jgi:hypothetical protein
MGKIASDPAYVAAQTKVTKDQSAANTAAFANCGSEIAQNKTCHATLDWTPYKSDIDALVAAAHAVEGESKAANCFLDLNLTTKADVLGNIKIFEKTAFNIVVSNSCTSDDRVAYLKFIKDTTQKTDPNITDYSADWTDPACASPTASQLKDSPKNCQKLGSETNCTVTHPHSYCGTSAVTAAVFTDGTGCSCNWGYDVDGNKCVQNGPAPPPKNCQTLGSTTNCTVAHPHSYCGTSKVAAAVFSDGTGCSCNWGYDVDGNKCVQDGPAPGPAPGPAGATCKSASGGVMPACPTKDDSCCNGPAGQGQSCFDKTLQECCTAGPGTGHVCAKGKCSTRAGFICN